jgi:glycosyltransferase involved in cell wall biosynthesis
MAAGIPVIATERSGGPDVIDHGKSGFIVPAGSADALRQAVTWCVGNRRELGGFGAEARAGAERFSWARYRERFFAAVCGVLDGELGGLKSAAD